MAALALRRVGLACWASKINSAVEPPAFYIASASANIPQAPDPSKHYKKQHRTKRTRRHLPKNKDMRRTIPGLTSSLRVAAGGKASGKSPLPLQHLLCPSGIGAFSLYGTPVFGSMAALAAYSEGRVCCFASALAVEMARFSALGSVLFVPVWAIIIATKTRDSTKRRPSCEPLFEMISRYVCDLLSYSHSRLGLIVRYFILLRLTATVATFSRVVTFEGAGSVALNEQPELSLLSTVVADSVVPQQRLSIFRVQ